MGTPVRLLVEDEIAGEIAFTLLHRSGLPLEDLTIAVSGRSFDQGPATPADQERLAALTDAEEQAPEAARARVLAALGARPAAVFVAVPNVALWLAADEDTARHLADFEARLKGLRGDENVLLTLASCVEIDRAAARFPSLREFLIGMADLLGTGDALRFEEGAGGSLPRDVVAGLVREIPEHEVAWRTASGTAFTSRELVAQIEAGTEIGRQYASDLLRVSRDFLRRRAKRSP